MVQRIWAGLREGCRDEVRVCRGSIHVRSLSNRSLDIKSQHTYSSSEDVLEESKGHSLDRISAVFVF